jgi:hypothetical protein
MRVELLHIAECPNAEAARRLLRQTLRELGLSEEILEIEVSDSSRARALAFPGSPTIRIDNNDVEPIPPGPGDYGLACRTYLIDGTLHGVPSREIIRKAIESVIARADREKKES